jgi:hypothetical protein
MSGKTARQWLFAEVFRSFRDSHKTATTIPAPGKTSPATGTNAASRHPQDQHPKAPKSRRSIQASPRPTSLSKLNFQRVTSELNGAFAPPADQAYLGSNKLPVKAPLQISRSFPTC